MPLRSLLFLSALAFLGTAEAALPPGAAADIAKANADWSAAMEKGDAVSAAAAYAPDAVFCTHDGKCYSGHQAILDMTRKALAARGAAKHAEAHTTRTVEDHGYIYEWGRAAIVTGAGKTVADGYFTVWCKQPDGHWMIFRNLVMP